MALLGHLHRQLAPALAAGLIPTKMVWVSSGSMAIDQMGIPSMGDHSFPQSVPPVFAAIDAVVGAGQDAVGVIGVDCHPPHLN